MILQLSAHQFEVDTKLRRYLERQIGGLDKYLPRAQRAVAEARIRCEYDPSGREDNHYVCEVIINNLPGGPIMSKEAALNIYAAVDIVEAKLKAQLAKHKTKRFSLRRRTRRAEPLPLPDSDQDAS